MEEDYSVKFKKGLIENGITNIKDYYYCGGTEGEGNNMRHYNYYKLIFGDKPFPKLNSKCICEHKITQNCYISKNKQPI